MVPAVHTAVGLQPMRFVSPMSNAKQRQTKMMMSLAEMDLLDDGLTPCWISIFLSTTLADATVDHEYIDGVHRFAVRLDGVIHYVDLAQSALRDMDADELLCTLEMIADRIAADARPGVITIRAKACDELQAV
jgi:hypothetical protein